MTHEGILALAEDYERRAHEDLDRAKKLREIAERLEDAENE